jgi:hypothetical protein
MTTNIFEHNIYNKNNITDNNIKELLKKIESDSLKDTLTKLSDYLDISNFIHLEYHKYSKYVTLVITLIGTRKDARVEMMVNQAIPEDDNLLPIDIKYTNPDSSYNFELIDKLETPDLIKISNFINTV